MVTIKEVRLASELRVIHCLTDDRKSDGLHEEGRQKPILGNWYVIASPSFSASAIPLDSSLLLIGTIMKKAEQYWPWNE